MPCRCRSSPGRRRECLAQEGQLWWTPPALADWDRPLDGFLFDLGVSSWQLDNPGEALLISTKLLGYAHGPES